MIEARIINTDNLTEVPKRPKPTRVACDNRFGYELGTPARQLAHVFDRFYQANQSTIDQLESPGIGLALVKELVEICRANSVSERTPFDDTIRINASPLALSQLNFVMVQPGAKHLLY